MDRVVRRLREKIKSLGGDVCFETKLRGIVVKEGVVVPAEYKLVHQCASGSYRMMIFKVFPFEESTRGRKGRAAPAALSPLRWTV